MLFFLVALFATSVFACAPAAFTVDPLTTSSGPLINAAALLAAGPPAVPCIESEIVRRFVQDGAPAVSPIRTGCPHLVANLVPFSLLNKAEQDVIVPAGTFIVRGCDVDAQIIRRIVVSNGATLVFDDAPIFLHVREILVEVGGTLLAGSALCPRLAVLDIMVHGTRASSSLSNAIRTQPSKGIIVEGVMELHGKRYTPTWTKLAKTANVGSTIIFLQQATNWEVGQQVLLTTTNWYDCRADLQSAWCNNRPHENEIRVIKSISMDYAKQVWAVELDAGLQYLHYGGSEYQGEVALLSRRIKIWGDASPDEFGVHVISLGSGRLYANGVWVDNGGQARVMGRYPLHLHMLYETQSIIENCLVTNSNFRAVTIHGTNSSRVSRNVAYNIKGHAFYLEDAVEEKNLFEFNAALHIHPIETPANGPWGGWGQEGDFFTATPERLLPADASAAGYYVSNAYNDFIGNVASGGWVGFAFPNIPRPLGEFKPFDYGNRNPLNRPTKIFRGNEAHSSGYFWRGHGSCFYVGAWLDYNAQGQLQYMSGRRSRETKNPDGSVAFLVFEDVKAWGCGSKGVAHWGDTIRLERYESHDNKNSAMFFGSTSMIHALVNAKSGNTAIRTAYGGSVMGFQWYDTWVKVILSDVTFRNFQNPDRAILYLTHSDEWTPQGINAVRGIKWDNTALSQRVDMEPRRCGVECGEPAGTIASQASKIASIWDWDGSVAPPALQGRPAIIGSKHPFWNAYPDCVKDASFGYWACPWTQNREIAYIQPIVKVFGMENCQGTGQCDGQRAMYTVGRMNIWGKPESEGLDLSPWPGISGPANVGWLWRVKSAQHGIDGAPSRFEVGRNFQMRAGAFIVLAIRYPDAAQFTVTTDRWGQAGTIPVMSMADILQPFESSPSRGLGYRFEGGYFYLRLPNPNCLLPNQCAMFVEDSVSITNIINAYLIQVQVQCNGCAVQSSRDGITFWSVPDTIPAAFPHNAGAARPAAPRSVWTRPSDCPGIPANPQTPAPQTPTPTTPTPQTPTPTTPTPQTPTPTTPTPQTPTPTTPTPQTPTPTTPTPQTPTPTTPTPQTTVPQPPATTVPPIQQTTVPVANGNFRVNPNSYPVGNVLTFFGGNYILRWDNTLLNNKIRIAVEAKINGWVGFGISRNNQKMVEADIVVGLTRSTGFSIEDRFATKFGLPDLDTSRGGVDNLENKFGGITNGEWTSIEFTRSITTNDPNDNAFNVGAPTEILLAFGTVNQEILYHGAAGRTLASVQFLNTPNEGSPNVPQPPINDGQNPLVPCLFSAPQATDDYRPFYIRMDMEWVMFDCPAILQRFANFFRIRVSRIKVLIARKGSVILELQITHDNTDNDGQLVNGLNTLLADVSNGSPSLRSAGLPVTSATSGRSSAVNPSSSGTLTSWQIALIVIAGVLLCALIVIIIIVVKRRGKYGSLGRGSRTYALLDDREMGSFAPETAVVPAPISNSDKMTFTLRTKYTLAADPTNHVLGAVAGQSFRIEKNDWESGGDWIWALNTSTGEQGYIPKISVQ